MESKAELRLRLSVSGRTLALIVVLALALTAAATFLAAHQGPAQGRGQAEPTAAQLAQYADEARRLFELLELRPGMTIAEVGAGRGEMTLEMAKRLGPSGRVYSTELDTSRLSEIRRAIVREQLTNVTVVQAAERVSHLPAGCCDAIFMRDVYHHFTHPEEYNRTLAAALKPGGRLVVIDFEPVSGMAIPEGVPANRNGHGVTPSIIIEEMRAAGLSEVRTIPAWTNLRPDRAMFLVLVRKP